MGAIYHKGVKYAGINLPIQWGDIDGTLADQTDLANALAAKTDLSTVGPVEDGTTASQAYAIGDHFIKDRYFCTATAAIAQGATLTLNTNYTQGDVAEAVNASPIKSAPFSGTTNQYGAISLGLNSANAVVVMITCSTYRSVIFANSARLIYGQLYDNALNPVTETSVSGTIYYIER